MEKRSTKRKTIDWRPEWSGEELEHYEAVKASLLEDASVIRTLRVRLDLSQAALAEILGTTQSNVSKIEAKDDPRVSTLRKIVEGKGGRLRIVADFGSGRSVELAA